MIATFPPLPTVSKIQFDGNPRKAVCAWLEQIRPPVPFDLLQCTTKALDGGVDRMQFEIIHSETIDGRTQVWRTGTITMYFNRFGTCIDGDWKEWPLFSEWKHVTLRPLWLHGQFWEFIPMRVRLLDPEYALDPFDGHADFKRVEDATNLDGSL